MRAVINTLFWEKQRSHEVGGRVKDKTIRGGCYSAFFYKCNFLLVICLDVFDLG